MESSHTPCGTTNTRRFRQQSTTSLPAHGLGSGSPARDDLTFFTHGAISPLQWLQSSSKLPEANSSSIFAASCRKNTWTQGSGLKGDSSLSFVKPLSAC